MRDVQAAEIGGKLSELWHRFGGMPTIVAGDFNCTDDEKTLTTIKFPSSDRALRDTQAEMKCASMNTLDARNPFVAGHPQPNRRIDYILASEEWRLDEFDIVLDGGSSGGPVSDHFGLYLRAVFA